MSKSQEVGEERLNAFFNTLLEELKPKAADPAVQRQVQRARKRARFVREELRAKAIIDFKQVNARMGELQNSPNRPSLALGPDLIANARLFITTVLERYTSSQVEDAIQCTLEPSLLLSGWRYGPGASHGIKGTHTADKIWQDMTCTALCEPYVRELRQLDPYFNAYDGAKGVREYPKIYGSALTTVLKNEDTERTIAKEPPGNMAWQLAAGLYLEGALRYIGLDIRKQQPKNKAMACRGSRDGSIATLDLKSASDCNGTDLVRTLMPPDWAELLFAIRSPQILIPEHGEGTVASWEELHMISSMGNGFTFPLMTLILVALIYAYRCRRGGPNLYVSWADTCVFGDDIIIPTHEYDVCVDTLQRAGFIVNNDKSFREGDFRESCGGDYMLGRDITPFYAKSLACDLDVYVVINQVLSWSAREQLFLPRTLAVLRTMLDGKPHLVPEWLGPDQGIQTSGCGRRYTYLSRVKKEVKLSEKAQFFSMKLAVGGYLTPRGDELFFLPRPELKMAKAKVRRSKLPRGYLDGWDPLLRSYQASCMIASYAAIMFGA